MVPPPRLRGPLGSPRLRSTLAGFAVGASLLAAAQVAGAQGTVTVVVPDCGEALYRFRFNGVGFVKTDSLTRNPDGTYAMPNDVDAPGIAYVGPATLSSPIPVVLDGEESFTLTGNCRNMTGAVVTGSAANEAYDALKEEFQTLNREGQKLARNLAVQKPDAPGYERAKADLKANDEAKLARLAELQGAGAPFLESVWAVNLLPSFANTEKPYTSELMYFINERFQYADFSEPIYATNPWVFESYRDFAATLLQAKLPDNVLEESLNTQLDLVYNNRPVHKLALGGVLAVLKQAQHPLGGTYAAAYLKRYGEEEPDVVEGLEADVKRLAAFSGAAAAPEFSQALLGGEGEAGPQDFKGKVLLVDFWASWCGPCRRENPSVVKMYDAYKDDGFEILGVSLDKTEAPWRAAVDKDGLTWTHVSDLRGWQNAAAQMYGVRSIPATFLLDREGRIVARNLRGAELEAKVAELVGGS